MARKIEGKRKYSIALAITIFVFILGTVLGLFIEDNKTINIEKSMQMQEIELNSMQVQFLLLEYSDTETQCSLLSKTIESNLRKLDEILSKIQIYEESNNLIDTKKEDYELLKRNFMISNMRYWLLAQKNQDLCGADVIDVLYFYSKDCGNCNNQGFILSYLRSAFDNKFLVFSIDESMNEPISAMMIEKYNVTKYPTLVINDVKYEGFMSKEEILKEVCPLYEKEWEVCENV